MTKIAININQLKKSNSKMTIDTKVTVELEHFIDVKTELLESDKKQTLYWVIRFMKFHNHQHPLDLMQSDIESFISSLATESHYNRKLQKSAELAILFLYQDFYQITLKPLKYISNQQRKGYLSYFGEEKCRKVAENLSGKNRLMLELMLLGNLKMSEVINLRESDVDIKNNRIRIYSHCSNGGHKRNRKLLFTVVIPLKLILDLRIQKMRIEQLFGRVRKIHNKANRNNVKNKLFFQTRESLFGPELNVDHIKQAFKLELKQAINATNHKSNIRFDENINKRFEQLKSEIGYPLESANIDRQHRYNESSGNYQLELEVA